MRIILLITGVVLLITCVCLFFYELYVFRKASTDKLSTIGKIVAANSTAALAFASREDASEILAALREEPHIVAASLYDHDNKLFVAYYSDSTNKQLPAGPGVEGFYFGDNHLQGFQPVVLDDRKVGTLYLKSDLGAMYERLSLYGIVVSIAVIFSFLLAWVLTNVLQKTITGPILELASTSTIVSQRKDYTLRAKKFDTDETGTLTDAFNHMLVQIGEQNQALSEFNQTLEGKVKIRTTQLETVNKELEAFSYSISHDLRAPLRGIIGFATILEEDYGSKLDNEGARITSVIKENATRMGRLIDDLLTFSRMSRQEIRTTKVDTTLMVKEIIGEMFLSDKYGTIQWTVHEMPDINADPFSMRQAWINLLSNAAKYSSTKEKPQIEIGSDNSNGQRFFYVRDNGVGFDEKYKHKLFGVFQRLHSADDFEGTGVGLAIVEKIISKHGGKVWAESKVDQGACFYFSL